MQDKQVMRQTFSLKKQSPIFKEPSKYVEGRMKKTMSTMHIGNLLQKKQLKLSLLPKIKSNEEKRFTLRKKQLTEKKQPAEQYTFRRSNLRQPGAAHKVYIFDENVFSQMQKSLKLQPMMKIIHSGQGSAQTQKRRNSWVWSKKIQGVISEEKKKRHQKVKETNEGRGQVKGWQTAPFNQQFDYFP